MKVFHSGDMGMDFCECPQALPIMFSPHSAQPRSCSVHQITDDAVLALLGTGDAIGVPPRSSLPARVPFLQLLTIHSWPCSRASPAHPVPAPLGSLCSLLTYPNSPCQVTDGHRLAPHVKVGLSSRAIWALGPPSGSHTEACLQLRLGSWFAFSPPPDLLFSPVLSAQDNKSLFQEFPF